MTDRQTEAVAEAIAKLRSCNLEYDKKVECGSCRNMAGYSDDVGCITLAQAAIAASEVKLIRGLVEALEQIRTMTAPYLEEPYRRPFWRAVDALATIPEEYKTATEESK